VWRAENPCPRLAVALLDLYGDRLSYRFLPPPRSNIASPKE
jgi:hypothetical protein